MIDWNYITILNVERWGREENVLFWSLTHETSLDYQKSDYIIIVTIVYFSLKYFHSRETWDSFAYNPSRGNSSADAFPDKYYKYSPPSDWFWILSQH